MQNNYKADIIGKLCFYCGNRCLVSHLQYKTLASVCVQAYPGYGDKMSPRKRWHYPKSLSLQGIFGPHEENS